MNSVNIVGNIGHDLELKQTNSGKSVLNFNIAVRQYNGDTSWFRVTAWEKLAETINQYCQKGSKVGVSGYLLENKFTDKEGNNRSSVEINAQSVDFMDAKKENGQQNNYQQADPFEQNAEETDISRNNLPF